MQLILLFRLLNWFASLFPERPEPPHLSRWDLLLLQVKQRREERERAEKEQRDSLPPPGVK